MSEDAHQVVQDTPLEMRRKMTVTHLINIDQYIHRMNRKNTCRCACIGRCALILANLAQILRFSPATRVHLGENSAYIRYATVRALGRPVASSEHNSCSISKAIARAKRFSSAISMQLFSVSKYLQCNWGRARGGKTQLQVSGSAHSASNPNWPRIVCRIIQSMGKSGLN